MNKEDNSMKYILVSILILVLLIAIIISIRYGNIFIFLGILVPIIIFMTIFLLISGMKKKITKALEKKYGDDVMIIATAFMDFFQVPLTIIVGVCLILFVLAVSCLIFISFIYPYLSEVVI
ncbi:MAG: hypothetical protein AB1765_09895 [Candidatus Hydrogenedentota bacterium]